MSAIFAPVLNRGTPPPSFVSELVTWAKSAPDELFAPNPRADIYARVEAELGPWTGLHNRKAVLLVCLLDLALFESECRWSEGVDASRRGGTTNENAEAGPWQESWNCRKLSPEIAAALASANIHKTNHSLAMTVSALVLRADMSDFNRIANGPIRKGPERKATWPDRPKLWDEKESIYPWLSRAAVKEFEAALA